MRDPRELLLEMCSTLRKVMHHARKQKGTTPLGACSSAVPATNESGAPIGRT